MDPIQIVLLKLV